MATTPTTPSSAPVTPSKKKRSSEWVMFLAIAYIVLLPISLGMTLGWLFTKLSRMIYAAIASIKKPQDIHVFKVYYLIIVMTVQLALFAVVMYFFVWTSADDADGLWELLFNGKSYTTSEITWAAIQWVGLFTAAVFLLVVFINDFLIAFYDKIIYETEKKDLKQIEDANALGETIEISHPILKVISFAISYKYSKKVNIYIEKNLLTAKIKANVDNGMIVNKELDIMFLKKFWPRHVLFAGTSNSGKSNDIANWLLSAAYLNCPIIYVYSDYSDDGIKHDLEAIATTLGKKNIAINFHTPSVKYNPFYKKNEEEIISLFTTAIIDPSNIKAATTITTVVTSIVTFMQQNGIALTIENVVKHVDPSFLKKQYLAESKISQFVNTLLIEPIVADKTIEAVMFFKYIKDIQKSFSKHFSSDPDAVNFYDILTSKTSNSILSISVPTSLPSRTAKLLDRLFLEDIKINSSYADSQRAMDKTKTVVCFSGLSDLFDTAKEVSYYLNLFSSKQICFGYGVRNFADQTAEEVNIFKQLFNSCGTYFIHKNSDLRIKENLLAEITNDRLVSPGFMIEDVMRKYKKRKLEKKEEIAQADTNVLGIKKTLVENSSYLPMGQIIFKSTVSENTNTSLGYKLEKDIVFNTPVQCMLFKDYLEYVKTKISGKATK